MNRPWHSVIAPLALAAIAGLTLWRTLAAETVVRGVGAGVVAGLLAGIVLTVRLPLRPGSEPGTAGAAAIAVARFLVAAGLLVAGAAIAAGAPRVVSRVGTTLATYLSVDLPALGLDELAMVPYLVVAPAAAVASWAGRRGRPLWVIVVTALAFVAGVLGTVPVGVPWWVPASFVAVLGALLLVVARGRYTDIEPLVGTSTAIRRQLPWWRPVVTGIPAVLVGLAALALPLPGAFDVRRYVTADVIVLNDENPLATAARLRRDPPPAADGVDVSVTVDGASPGRLRLAVVDDYAPEGWRPGAEFAVTGEVLAPPPLSAVDEADRDVATTSVVVQPGPGVTGLRGAPTAGSPVAVTDPDGIRYSAQASVFLPAGALDGDGTGASGVSYRSVPAPEIAPPGAQSAPAGVPAALYRCPSSTVIDDIAGTLTDDVTAPLQRLERIESWLKLRKIYDPQAPGGQTLRSVEAFLSEDFARGNLEVFVTAYALLARCADVPVRIVVGYPAPPSDGRRDYTADEIDAWVETPLADVGWLPLDPVPTPEEQRRQAEVAQQPPPPPVAPTPISPPLVVEATSVDDGLGPFARAVLILLLVGALVAALVAVGAALRQRTLAKRRRFADPSAAVLAAWRSVIERLRDAGVVPGPHLTATETARATSGRVPSPVTRLLTELAVLTDRARFDPESTTSDHAGVAWAMADAALARSPMTAGVWAGPLRHPRRSLARLQSTRGQPRQRQPWTAELPESALVTEGPELLSVPGYEIEGRIGGGSTAVVYRAHDLETGRPVAIKVFTVELGGRDVDGQRFAWEARVAELVSGRPHLPEVYGSGTMENGQPYLVSKLYERGTLHRRVQRGGALTPGEVASAGRQLALALETLHQHSILHGDVKPENVFVDDDGTMVLGDLGSAWLRADGGPAAAVTPPYAAPEVWLGHAPTAASDLYSLGLTLMFAASARVPMAGSAPREDEIVEAFGSDLPLPLLEIDPRRRPRTALAAAVILGAGAEELFAVRGALQPLPTPTFSTRR